MDFSIYTLPLIWTPCSFYFFFLGPQKMCWMIFARIFPVLFFFPLLLFVASFASCEQGMRSGGWCKINGCRSSREKKKGEKHRSCGGSFCFPSKQSTPPS